MALLIITTILWAFSFSFYGEYLAGHVDSYFAVLVRVGLAALVFLPFLRTRGNSLKTVGLYMLVGAMQLGVMYMLSFRAYLYLTVSELLLFTVLTPLYITLIYDIMSKRRLRWVKRRTKNAKAFHDKCENFSFRASNETAVLITAFYSLHGDHLGYG